ncbi:MAG: ribonuclease R [Tissierellia bacterium]|nr:ribonuclease R [Tissierellia bacterium]
MTKKLIEGTLSINKSGFGFVVPDDKTMEDIFIPRDDINKALDKDRVKVKIIKQKTKENRAEGKIVEVIERNNSILIGRFEKVKNYGFVVLDGNRNIHDIFIPTENINGAKNGDKVIVEIDFFNKKDKNPTGIIKEVLGGINDLGIEILAIAKKYELPDIFSKETINYAKSLPKSLTEEDYKNREDFRNLFTVTIDGRTSKDFDDAISIEMEDDKYVLYVHIADVTHYVKEKTDIDNDALERGNSVYLLDRVIPMFPEELSNNLCSLIPEEDRLAVTVKMYFNEKAKLLDYKFYESVINSDYRLVYDDVSDYIEKKSNVYKDNLLCEKLDLMYDLSQKLQNRRDMKGALDFNFKETEIELNELGEPIKIGIAERREANRLIENFMVVTNEVVGDHFANISVPFMYRVHEKPSEEKLMELKKIISKFGLIIKGQEIYSKDLQEILKKVEGTNIEMLINNLMLRSMKKAEYKREPDIHFGLASHNYSHFTAPIRRYSDVVVHRILKNSLHNFYRKPKRAYLKKLDYIAEHVSEMERRAEEAERDVEELKKAEYMKDKIGEVFEGTISSLTNFGIFVELENTVEGLIHFRNFTDDYYEFDEENYIVIGTETGKTYELGQKVRVRVEGVSIELREIDFKLVKDERGKKNNSK